MRRQTPLLVTCLAWSAIVAGCGSPEPPIAEVAPATTSQPDDGSSAQRARIARMYEGYRAQAFADVGEIELEGLEAGEEGGAILLVDCREDREQAVSMIDGAIAKADFEAAMSDDPGRYRDRLIVTYCTIGYRSGIYAKALAGRGLDARNLVGGVLAWAHDGRSFVDADGNRVQRVHVYGSEWDLLPQTYESVYEGKPPP